MAESDKTLKLLIELGVVGKEDAQTVTKLLDEQKTASAGLAKEMGVITVTGADAAKILGQTGKEAAESGKNSRELHRVFGELNRIVPGLGEALNVAFHPESIGILGALVAFEALKSVLESIQAIDEIKLADFAGSKDAVDAVDAVRDSYEQARVAAQMFVDEQNRLNAAGVGADETAKRQIENFKNLAGAQEQFNSAQKKLGEAEIDAREKKGVISHAEANQEKFALDVEYAKKKLVLEAQTDAAELAAKQQQLATQKTQLGLAQGDQAGDEANAAATAATKAKHAKQKETAQKNIESAQKTLDELGKSHGSLIQGQFNDETAQQLEEYYEKYVGNPTGKSHSEMFAAVNEKMKSVTGKAGWDLGLTNFMDRTIGQQEGEAGFAKYDGAKQQISGAQQEIKKLEASQFQVDLNAERGKKQLEATDEAVRKLSASVAALSREIPQQQADAATKLKNNAAVENLDLRADAISKGLTDPGNTFIAPIKPGISPAASPVTNQTPWRDPGAEHPITAQAVAEIAHSKAGLLGAAKAIHDAHMDHDRAIRLALENVAKEMGMNARQIMQLEAQMTNSRNRFTG